MAVTYDAVGPAGGGGAGPTATGANTINLTWDHVVATGPSSVYVAYAVAQSGAGAGVRTGHTRTVTCGGSAMTLLGGYHENNSSTLSWVEVYEITGQTAGTKAISVTVAKSSVNYTNLIGGSVGYRATGSSTFIAGTGGTSNATTMAHTLTGAASSYLLRICSTQLTGLQTLSNNARVLKGGQAPCLGMHDVTNSTSTGFTAVRAQGDDWASIGVEVKVNAITGTIGAAAHTATASVSGAMQPKGTIGASIPKAAASLSGTATTKMAALVDTFDAGIGADWTKGGNNTAEVTAAAGAVRIDHTAAAEYNILSSTATYDLTGSCAYIQVVDFGNQTLGSHSASMGAWIDNANRIDVYAKGGWLVATKYVANVATDLGVIALDTTNHRWWKIYEAGGSIYVDTAPDGVTWTNRWSVANPWPVTAMYAYLWSGSNGEASGSYAIFDNFNLVPTTATVAAALKQTTFTAAGNQPFTGSVSASARKVTASFSGGQTYTGTIGAAAKKATASLSGTSTPPPATGTIGAAAKKAAASLSGAMQPRGTLATATPKATAALTATQTYTGTVTAAANHPTAAVTAAMWPKGSISSAVKKTAASVTASHIVTGSITAAGRKLATLMSGVQHPRGAVAAAVKKPAGSASGGQTYTGTVTAAAAKLITSATAAMWPKGVIGSASKKLTAALTATQTYTGSIVAAGQKLTATTSGYEHAAGTVTGVSAPLMCSASGEKTAPGTMASVVCAVTATVSGAEQPSGTLTAAGQHPRFAAAATQIQQGTLTALIRSIIVSAGGGALPRGTVTSRMQPAAAAAAATQIQVGLLAAHTHVVAAVLAGVVPSFGELAGLLSAATMYAEGFGGIAEGGIITELKPTVFAGGGTRSAWLSHDRATTIAAADRATTITAALRSTLIAAAVRATTIPAADRSSTIGAADRGTTITDGAH